MRENEIRPPHLSDEEIDAYSRSALAEAAEARVEQHYLDCEACHDRVRFSQDLITALAGMRAEQRAGRSHRAWRAAAALLAVAGAVAVWQLAERAGSPPTPPAPAATAAARPEVVVRLTPPTRDGEIAVLDVPAERNLRLVIDVREGGAPGTHFAVTIATMDGEPIYHASDLVSSASGELEVRIGSERLPPGTYLLEARAGGATIGLPFRVRE